MAEDSRHEVQDYLNCRRITFGDTKHQSRLYFKAIQYMIKPSCQLAFSEVFLAAMPLITFCFVAHGGYDHLIGAGYGISLCSAFGLGFCYVSATACHEFALEKEDSKEAVATIQRGLILTLSVMSFPIWAVWLNAGPLFNAFKQQPKLSSLGDEYCFMFLPGLPIFIIVLFLQKYMNLVRENAVLPIVSCNILATALNIGLNAAFVNGLNMGVRGGALALVVTYLCMALYLLFCIILIPRYRKAWPGWSWGILLEWKRLSLRLLPYLAWIMVEWWTLDVGIFVVGALDAFNRRLGSQILICLVVRLLATIADKFASEASDQIVEAVNARYFNRAVFITKCAMLIMWVGSLFCGVFLAALPRYIPLSFTNYRNFGMSTREIIYLISPIPFLKGTQALGFKVVRKVKSRVLNLVFVVIGFWIFALPTGLSVMYLGGWGITGFWIGYTIGLLFQALMFMVNLKDFMQEWKLYSESKSEGPPTPSGMVQSENDETDGYHGKSLLLWKPRIRAKFIMVEITRDELDGSTLPSRNILISRGFVILLSLSILIAGVVARAFTTGFHRHVPNAL